MEMFVHFAVGLAGGFLLLMPTDFHARDKFVLAFGSAIWALLPDGHWMFHEFGIDGPAAAWKAFHDTSALTNVFWLHQRLDRMETGRPKLEIGFALAGLLLVVGIYYVGNDWEQ